MTSTSKDGEKQKLINNINTNFKTTDIKEILKSRFSNAKTKLTDESTELISELAKVMVVESAVRAAKQAKNENRNTVTLDQVEAILPQIMLDFP